MNDKDIPHYVLDVNVLLRTVTGRQMSPDTVLYRKFVRGECRFLFSEALLHEFKRVLDYPEIIALGMTPGLAFSLAIDLLQFGLYLPFVETPRLAERN